MMLHAQLRFEWLHEKIRSIYYEDEEVKLIWYWKRGVQFIRVVFLNYILYIVEMSVRVKVGIFVISYISYKQKGQV